MVGPCQSNLTLNVAAWLFLKSSLVSRMWREDGKLPSCQDHKGYFPCCPAVVTAFCSVNALSTSGWSEAWPRLPSAFWWS